MIKVISELFKALRKERGSLETKTSCFGALNIMNFLGNLRGVLSLFVFLFLAWFFIILLVSCGSSKLTSSEKVRTYETAKVSQDSTVQASTTTSLGKERSTTDSVSTTKEREEESSENSETITITETTIYDTGDTASNANLKVSKTIKQTKIEKHGSSLSAAQKEKTNKTFVEVTKEKKDKNTDTKSSSSATIGRRKETEFLTDKEQSVSESKQTLFIALTFFGVALVLLVGMLAHWVFSKYRRKN